MKATPTMSEVLRRRLLEDERNWFAVATAAGVDRSALIRFAEGRVSIRLDTADKLARFYGLELREAK